MDICILIRGFTLLEFQIFTRHVKFNISIFELTSGYALFSLMFLKTQESFSIYFNLFYKEVCKDFFKKEKGI